MYCANCGNKLSVGGKFCPSCGKAVKKDEPKSIGDKILKKLEVNIPQRVGEQINLKEYRQLFEEITDISSSLFTRLSPSLKKLIKGQLHFTDLESLRPDGQTEEFDQIVKEFRYLFNRAVIAGYLTLVGRLEGKLYSDEERRKIISEGHLSAQDFGSLWGKYNEMWFFAYVPPEELIEHFYGLFQDQLYLLDDEGWEFIRSNIYINMRMGQLIALEEGFPLVSRPKSSTPTP